MKGVLLGAFCERGEQVIRCLELWAYPDLSLNLVINRFGPDGEEEYAFPCAPHHLINVLRERPFRMEIAEGSVTVSRGLNNLIAEFTSASQKNTWVQSVPVEPFVSALALVAPEAEAFQDWASLDRDEVAESALECGALGPALVSEPASGDADKIVTLPKNQIGAQELAQLEAEL